MNYQDLVETINSMGITELRNYAIKLVRENVGLKTKVENLNRKLYKRYEGYRGEVFDKDARKRGI